MLEILESWSFRIVDYEHILENRAHQRVLLVDLAEFANVFLESGRIYVHSTFLVYVSWVGLDSCVQKDKTQNENVRFVHVQFVQLRLTFGFDCHVDLGR